MFDIIARFRQPQAERYEAFVVLLHAPDLPCLLSLDAEPRGTHDVQAGDDRRREQIKRELGRAYVRWRMFDAGEDVTIVRVRRLMLQVARRA